MRWTQSAGMVRWRRIDPRFSEILSGGVGLVRWCRFGMWDETWDFLTNTRPLKVEVAQGLGRNTSRSARQNWCHINRILADVKRNFRNVILKCFSHRWKPHKNVSCHLASWLIRGGCVATCNPKRHHAAVC